MKQARHPLYLLLFSLGCIMHMPAHAATDTAEIAPLVSTNPQTAMIYPANTLGADNDSSQQAVLKLPDKPLSLAEISDFALTNNPTTHLAWAQAKFAAASLGVAKSAYWPQLNVGASVEHSNDFFTSPTNTQNTYGANISLSYLLLDFGNRANQVRSARYNLIAANLNQNSQIQQVVLQTQQAYYQVLGQQALVEADIKSVAEAKTSLSAAQALRRHGMATVGDVYQAQGSLAQANLNWQQAQGDCQTALGQLATNMGLAANTPLQLLPLSAIPAMHAIQQNVATLMAQATQQRPDLLAAEAQLRASQAQLAATQASARPSVQLNANSAPTFQNNENATNAAVTLSVSVPLFTGFSHTYALKQAKAQTHQAQATRDQLHNQVQLQVWQAYAALDTAEKSMTYATLLLASSEQAVKQAMGQYKAGVGNMLTVLTTQSSLANARAQSIQARLNWYTALAQLSQAMGAIGYAAYA